jgi:hypothetical protein
VELAGAERIEDQQVEGALQQTGASGRLHIVIR